MLWAVPAKSPVAPRALAVLAFFLLLTLYLVLPPSSVATRLRAVVQVRKRTGLRALLSRKTSIRDHKGIVVAKKMSRKVSRRVVRPACIAGVRISRPNFRAPCGRTKL